MNQNKFREIFIAQTESGKPVILNLAEHPDSLFASISKGVKYIEIAAMEQLKAENNKLREQIKDYEQDLKLIADRNAHGVMVTIAREALKKWSDV